MPDTIATDVHPAPPLPQRKRRPRTSTLVLSGLLVVTTLGLGAVAVSLSAANAEISQDLTTTEGDLASVQSRLTTLSDTVDLVRDQVGVCQSTATELHSQLGVMIDDVVRPLNDALSASLSDQFLTATAKVRSANDSLDGLTARIKDNNADYAACLD